MLAVAVQEQTVSSSVGSFGWSIGFSRHPAPTVTSTENERG
jgi:hypothetical protein